MAARVPTRAAHRNLRMPAAANRHRRQGWIAAEPLAPAAQRRRIRRISRRLIGEAMNCSSDIGAKA